MGTIRKARRVSILKSAVFLVWLGTVVFLLSRHENWRDEAQAWLMVRDLNVAQLIRQMPYEGHPCLWHLILMPFAKLGLPYRSSNAVSLVLVAIAAALLIWKSPIPLTWQVPVLFGSAFLYFMPVITRSYALVPPLVLLCALHYRDRRRRPLAYGLSVALLVQIHVYLLPFAGALSLFWLAEALTAYRQDRDSRLLLRQGAGLVLPFISLLLFLAQVSGAKKSSAFSIDWESLFSPRVLLNQKNIGIFGLKMRNMDGAVPAILLTKPRLSFLLILFVLLVPAALLLLAALRKHRGEVTKAAAIYLLTVMGELGLTLLLGRSALQKTAILAFFPIWLLWVIWPELQENRTLRRLALSAYAGVALFFLVLNSAAVFDINGCYSDGADCAAFIRENLPEDAVIFQNTTSYSSSVVAYLDAKGFYSLESGELESYAKWVEREPTVTDYESFCALARQANPNAERAYLLIQMDTIGPYTEILDHAEEDFLVYSTFAEKDPPPMECYILLQIPIQAEN